MCWKQTILPIQKNKKSFSKSHNQYHLKFNYKTASQDQQYYLHKVSNDQLVITKKQIGQITRKSKQIDQL